MLKKLKFQSIPSILVTLTIGYLTAYWSNNLAKKPSPDQVASLEQYISTFEKYNYKILQLVSTNQLEESIEAQFARYKELKHETKLTEKEFISKEFLRSNGDLYKPLLELDSNQFLDARFKDFAKEIGSNTENLLNRIIESAIFTRTKPLSQSQLTNNVYLLKKVFNPERIAKWQCMSKLMERPDEFVRKNDDLFSKARSYSQYAAHMINIFCGERISIMDQFLVADEIVPSFFKCLSRTSSRIDTNLNLARECLSQSCKG